LPQNSQELQALAERPNAYFEEEGNFHEDETKASFRYLSGDLDAG
jgi:hypothetical protein